MPIERRVSPVTGRVSYRVRVRHNGRWISGGTYARLRPRDGESSAEQALADLRARVVGQFEINNP